MSKKTNARDATSFVSTSTVVARENLARALALASRAARNKSSLPVLSNVLVEVGGENGDASMRLSATDLEIGMRCRIPVMECGELWATTIPARTFLDLVNTLPDEPVALDLNGKTQSLKVKCGGSNTTLKGIDAAEFPPFPAADNWQDAVPFPAVALREAIKQVAFCASQDEARPVLTGVHITVKGQVVTFEAADGFRLARKTLELGQAVKAPMSAIVPAKALQEVEKVAALCDEVRVLFTPNRGQVIFHSETADVISQVIEGTYPDLEQVVPKSHTCRTVVDRAAMLNAVKQADIFAREGPRICKLDICATGNPDELPDIDPMIRVAGQSEETGQNQTDVLAEVEGEDIVIAFNAAFLRELLDAMPTPRVALETTADTSPGLFRPVGEGDYSVVIMPMHINK